MFQFNFERLDVWQNARELNNSIYKVCAELPLDTRDYLLDEIKTSSLLVGTKLAYGSAMFEMGEKAESTSESLENLMRLLNLLTILHDLAYMDEVAYNGFRNKIFGIQKQLKALRNKQVETMNN